MAKEEAEEGIDLGAYESGYTADPEGYDASIDAPVEVVAGNGATADAADAATANQDDDVAELLADPTDPEGIAVGGGHDAPEWEADGTASANLVETGQDALAGQVPPAADESRLGVHPDAAD